VAKPQLEPQPNKGHVIVHPLSDEALSKFPLVSISINVGPRTDTSSKYQL
jgi:hypothetical protein